MAQYLEPTVGNKFVTQFVCYEFLLFLIKLGCCFVAFNSMHREASNRRGNSQVIVYIEIC